MTARTTFDLELKQLNLEIIKMGTMIEEAIENSIIAFKEQDSLLAERVIENDCDVDDIEKEIEARCLKLILRQQPVAKDLRIISTAQRIITDMERIGDNAEDIARISITIKGEHIFEMVHHIPQMVEITVKMVHDSVKAFVTRDMVLARTIIKTDDVVDELFCKVKADISQILKEDKDEYNNTMDFLMIAKYLERIADHAVNICEWVEFSLTGEHKNKKIL